MTPSSGQTSAISLPPPSPIEQSFLDRRPSTPAERLRLGDTLAIRHVYRDLYKRQRIVTDTANARLVNKDAQLQSMTGKYTVAQSKASKRGATNILLAIAVAVVSYLAITN